MSEDEPKEIENKENIEFTEKEIIYYCKMFIDNANETFKKVQNDGCLSLSVYNSDIKAIQGLLDLYQKQKEKNIAAILECMEEVNDELIDNLINGEPTRKPAREKIKKLEKENAILNRRLKNVEENYTQLIEDVSTLAIALELQEDATIDEMYEEIKNLQEECKETDLEAQKYFEKYEDEKEKNRELQRYMKNNLISKSTINLLYISKDKIKKVFDVKIHNFNYLSETDWDEIQKEIDKGVVNILENILQELLEENNGK